MASVFTTHNIGRKIKLKINFWLNEHKSRQFRLNYFVLIVAVTRILFKFAPIIQFILKKIIICDNGSNLFSRNFCRFVYYFIMPAKATTNQHNIFHLNTAIIYHKRNKNSYLLSIIWNCAQFSARIEKKKHNISIILALFVYFSGAETYFMYSVDLACDFNDISILGGRRATQLGQIELQLINTTSDRKLEAIYLSEVHFSLILLHMPPLYMECKTYHRVMKINQLKGRPCVQDQKKSILQTMIESSKEAFYSIAEI